MDKVESELHKKGKQRMETEKVRHMQACTGQFQNEG